MFKWYGQFYQYFEVLKLLNFKRNGYFLDQGVFHQKNNKNIKTTRFFYKKHWGTIFYLLINH